MEKVEEAKDIAHAAALTPLVPSPKDPLRPAFQLYAEVDLPILAAGIVFTAARLFRSQPAYCAPKCDPAELNALDRTTAGTWGPPWAVASNYALYGLMGGSALALIVDEGPLAGLNDLVVVAESAMSATGLAAMLTLASGRPRPYLYGDDAPLTERNSPDAGLSFLSGHTTVSFAIVTSTYVALQRIHPNSRWPLLALGLGGGGAAFVGVSRVMAGKHFITDVLGGAVVGSSVGVLVSSLHGSPVRIVPVVSDLQKGVDLMGTF